MLTWEEFFAGWIGGISGLVVGHPMETVKVYYQTNNTKILSSIQAIYRNHGIQGFYKGMTFPALTAGMLNAVFFGVYSNSLRHLLNSGVLKEHLKDTSWNWPVFSAGTYAGIVQTLVGSPVEIMKIKFQSQLGDKAEYTFQVQCRTLLQCVKNTYKVSGIAGFYRGLTPMIFRDGPTGGIYMWSYIHSNTHLSERNIHGLPNHLISGGIAGIASWSPVIPFDVIKTRIQTDNQTPSKYKGIIDCANKSYKQGGFMVFWRGFNLVCLRAFFSNAALFTTYELCMKALN